jgi:hypothetical protein
VLAIAVITTVAFRMVQATEGTADMVPDGGYSLEVLSRGTGAPAPAMAMLEQMRNLKFFTIVLRATYHC